VAERGDQYRADVDPDDLPGLYRVGSLISAGVPVAAGTDAPFGSPDPWASIAAAVDRRTRAGHVLGGSERVDPGVALDLYLGRADAPASPRVVAEGQPADLCVLAVPWRDLETIEAAPPVRCTLVGGEPIHHAP
jgi:predicted amidohydrolase YtcJ